MTSAEIITIGTEILLGEIVDNNTRYLVRNLRGLGVAQSPESRLIDLSPHDRYGKP